jgi:hypothetical protein
MRTPTFESGYEYCVLSASTVTAKKGGTPNPNREGLYRLGAQNENLSVGEMWRQSYDEILKYLQTEHWEFMVMKDYPFHGRRSKRRLQLRYYRRLPRGEQSASPAK